MFLPFFFVFVNFIFAWGSCDDSGWHIEAIKNPGQCENQDIWYILAKNASSSVHSFLCASDNFSTPTILIVHSSVNSTVADVKCSTSNTSFTPSIKVKNVTQSYALLLHSLIEYNDESDNVTVAWVPLDDKYGKIHHFADFNWKPSQANVDANSSIWQFNFTAYNAADPIFAGPGKVSFQISISREKQTNPKMPHLKFVPGLELQFELVLDNLTTNYKNGRFAAQLALVSNQSLSEIEEFERESRFSIDDEITPGTFEMINLKLGDPVYANNKSSSQHVHPHPSAYVQMKPICYTDFEHREIKNSRDVLIAQQQDKPSQNDLGYIDQSLARAFYGARFKHDLVDLKKPVGIRLLNISFGTVADGFYANSHFLVWTASFGLGQPPTQRLSALLIGLIVLSIVIILCSIIFGTLLILIIRARQRRHEFSLLRETGSHENLNAESAAL